MNESLYRLYRLSPEERNLVENEHGHRNAALATGGIGLAIRVWSRHESA